MMVLCVVDWVVVFGIIIVIVGLVGVGKSVLFVMFVGYELLGFCCMGMLILRRRIGFCLGNRVGMVMGMKWWCSLSVGVFAFVCW